MGFKSGLVTGQGTEVEPVSASCNRRPDEGLETQRYSLYPRNIQPTAPYGGGSVMVWGGISHDCKLDLVIIQGNLTGDQYIRDVLQPVVVPHFSLQLDFGCPVVIAAAIPDAMLLPTDECFAQEVPEPVYDGLTCPKYALWDSNHDNLIVLFEL
jgi:hypothetical protein